MSAAQQDIRDAYFDTIYTAGMRDPNLVIITNDMDVFSLRRFKQDFPDRFINVGVAEQNMINVAAGLASCGKTVVIYGISSFVTFRCYEQLRFNICSMKLPVVIVGIGSGLAFSFDGPTHHGTQDVAVMRALPEMSIYNPGDTVAAEACARLSLKTRGPAYVRIDKGMFPALHDPAAAFDDGYGILRPLADLNILSTGYMTPQALALAETLAARGLTVGVVDIFRLKPLGEHLTQEVLARSRGIVTMEENALTGGLGSAISELITDAGLPTRLLRLALADEQILCYGNRDWLLARDRLDPVGITERIAAFATGL